MIATRHRQTVCTGGIDLKTSTLTLTTPTQGKRSPQWGNTDGTPTPPPKPHQVRPMNKDAQRAEAFTPPGVQVQRIATPPGRYDVDPATEGESMREWRYLRGETDILGRPVTADADLPKTYRPTPCYPRTPAAECCRCERFRKGEAPPVEERREGAIDASVLRLEGRECGLFRELKP